MGPVLDNFGAWFAAGMIALAPLSLLPARRGVLFGVAAAFAVATSVLPVFESTVHVVLRTLVTPLGAAYYIVAGSMLATFGIGKPIATARDEATFATIVALSGAALYASALDFIRPDFYRSGFDGRVVVVLVLAALAAGVAFRSWMTLGWIGLAAVMKIAGVVDSANAFDHFIDPLAWITCVTLALAHALAKFTPWTLPFLGYRMSARPGRPIGWTARTPGAT